uniref:Uncharacterized protein n=1 Tax=Candidatus Methanogaster sp. ANME-2c ERB4 TaxID=2759911 RepID=A0A7G9Y015_9EURY|nr:hypothetical protein CALKMFAI_00001 [Methanosarcinales archaeon ANME-2c ERB4]
MLLKDRFSFRGRNKIHEPFCSILLLRRRECADRNDLYNVLPVRDFHNLHLLTVRSQILPDYRCVCLFHGHVDNQFVHGRTASNYVLLHSIVEPIRLEDRIPEFADGCCL